MAIAGGWFSHDLEYPSYDFVDGFGRTRISHKNSEFVTPQTEYDMRRRSFS